MTQLSVADVLERAADLIEPEGAWTQGEYARGKSGYRVTTRAAAVCYCAMGAISVVSGSPPGDDAGLEAWGKLQNILPRDEYGCIQDIPEWNDAPGRTQAEVVAKLREAAALARTQPTIKGE